MSIGDLYAELGVDFKAGDRAKYLQEFADVAHDYQGDLGPSRNGARDIQLQELAAELGKDVVEFSPKLTALALNKRLFNDLKLEMPPYIASLLRHYHFYLVNFPISVVPRPGGGFAQLECILEFNPDRPPAERPVAYQIFPQEEWQPILHAWQGLKVGLNENFEFKVDPLQAAPPAAEAGAARQGGGATQDGGTGRPDLRPIRIRHQTPENPQPGTGGRQGLLAHGERGEHHAGEAAPGGGAAGAQRGIQGGRQWRVEGPADLPFLYRQRPPCGGVDVPPGRQFLQEGRARDARHAVGRYHRRPA
jgi:hypothetical protein